jgi:elongation factor Ts
MRRNKEAAWSLCSALVDRKPWTIGEQNLEITTAMVKELRQATGAGVLDCRKALEASAGDFESAVVALREKGLAAAAKRAGRQASDGRVEAYVHPGNRIAVLLELNCETDFVARTDDFKTLTHDLALHIAFAAPRYLAREDVPGEVVERERAVYRAQALEEGKPERIVDRIIEGRLGKFYQQVCLMEQTFVKDEEKTIQELISDAIAKLGENVVMRRFVRYQLGEGLD